MIEIETKEATDKLRKIGIELSQAQISKAIVRSLNYAARSINTIAKRQVRQIYNIPNYNMDKTTEVQNANTSTLTAGVKADLSTLSLSAFNPTVVQTMGKSRIRGVFQRKGGKKGGVTGSYATSVKINQGVYVEILKGQKQYLPGAWMGFWNKTDSFGQRSASGGAIFARGKYGSKGFEWAKGRSEFNKLKTKSVYWALMNNAVGPVTVNRGMEQYEKRLIHELTQGISYGGAK